MGLLLVTTYLPFLQEGHIFSRGYLFRGGPYVVGHMVSPVLVPVPSSTTLGPLPQTCSNVVTWGSPRTCSHLFNM